MSVFVIALLIALSAGTWAYSKLYSRTGGNNQNAIIGGATTALVLFIILYLTLSTFLN